MEYRHTPVLLAEVTQLLSLHPGSIVVDCTLGGAGHAKRIQDSVAPTGLLVGIDQDDAALVAAADVLRLGQQGILIKGDFGELDRLLTEAGLAYADGFLFDLGVSSPQLDVAERGFSYRADAPLDMRMDPEGGGITAADVVNSYDEAELTRIILPPALREYAGLKQDVSVTGSGERIELWDTAAWTAYDERVTENIEAAAGELARDGML